MSHYDECICECGDMLCTGFNWCADCAEWHHGEPCATEAPEQEPDGLTPLQTMRLYHGVWPAPAPEQEQDDAHLQAVADRHMGQLAPRQAALDAEQFPDATTYQERHWSDMHFVGMY